MSRQVSSNTEYPQMAPRLTTIHRKSQTTTPASSASGRSTVSGQQSDTSNASSKGASKPRHPGPAMNHEKSMLHTCSSITHSASVTRYPTRWWSPQAIQRIIRDLRRSSRRSLIARGSRGWSSGYRGWWGWSEASTMWHRAWQLA